MTFALCGVPYEEQPVDFGKMKAEAGTARVAVRAGAVRRLRRRAALADDADHALHRRDRAARAVRRDAARARARRHGASSTRSTVKVSCSQWIQARAHARLIPLLQLA